MVTAKLILQCKQYYKLVFAQTSSSQMIININMVELNTMHQQSTRTNPTQATKSETVSICFLTSVIENNICIVIDIIHISHTMQKFVYK